MLRVYMEATESCSDKLNIFAKMQASWICLSPQTKPRGCVHSALLLCDSISSSML